jgi:hypothetical protein
MSKLTPSRSFLGVGMSSIIPCSSISLLMTFGSPENYRTESVAFNIAEVNLPFNTILGSLTLYQFMVIAHYGYLILKMLAPNDIIKIRGDRSADVSTLEKLQALAAAEEAIVGYGESDQAPSRSRKHDSTSAPRV